MKSPTYTDAGGRFIVIISFAFCKVQISILPHFRFFLKNSAKVSQGIMFLGWPLPAFSS